MPSGISDKNIHVDRYWEQAVVSRNLSSHSLLESVMNLFLVPNFARRLVISSLK